MYIRKFVLLIKELGSNFDFPLGIFRVENTTEAADFAKNDILHHKLYLNMNTSNKKISVIFILLTIILNSCSSEETKYVPPTLVNFPETGLIGQSIMIQVENVEVGKLQVFFDSEEAQVNYISDKEIMVVVPRTIKTNTPTLKVIDLNENKTILNKIFSLKKPIISKYNSDEVTFNETFTIYGENFDIIKDFITVSVNNENATIINVDYNKIEIQIPNKIKTANLEIKVRAQLQEVTSGLSLQLKLPEIIGINNSSVFIGSELLVFGKNLNPNLEFGEVFINDIRCFFSTLNNKLSITIPPGPYKDFKITNVTYKTAGLSTSFDCEVPIQNYCIMVDDTNGYSDQTVFVHNNKAYQFKYTDNGSYDFNFNYTLLEFSPVTEKWTELSTFSYKGYIDEAVYDGEDSVFIYKRNTATQEYALTKLNINTFQEVSIDLPSNKIRDPIMFAYNDNLYLLSGLNSNGSSVTVRNQKYRYSKGTNQWTVLPDSAFPDLPLAGIHGNPDCDYLFSGNDIYISYNVDNRTYKINPSLDVTVYSGSMYFEYRKDIIAKAMNRNEIIYNMTGNNLKNLSFNISGRFFNLNNQIYCVYGKWLPYYTKTNCTLKLKKEYFNELF